METPAFRSVLFAVDDSDESAHAAPLVARYAHDWGARLHMLHVHRGDEAAATARDRGAFVTAMVDAICARGVKASGEVRLAREDDVASAVARVARRQEAELVAVGSRGRRGIAAALVPSVSRGVASALRTPVLVARVAPGARARGRRIMVAIDVSEAAAWAIKDAIRFATPTGMAVRIVHVLAAGETDGDAEPAVGRAWGALRAAGLQADQDVVLAAGSVPAAIAAAARRWDADVLALASRRPGQVRGLVVGSVAHELMQTLDLPVLLAHRG